MSGHFRLLLISFCLCASLAQAQSTFGLGSSSNHLLGGELEFTITPDLNGFLGVGGVVFPIPTFDSSPSVLLLGMISTGVRYWSETPNTGPFAEAGLGLFLSNLGMGSGGFALLSAGYRWTNEGVQFDLGLSTFLIFESIPRYGLLPRFSIHWLEP